MPIDAGKRGFEVDSGYSHSRCTIPLMLPHPQVRRTEIKMYNRTAALDRPRAGSFSYSDSSAEPEAEAAPSPLKRNSQEKEPGWVVRTTSTLTGVSTLNSVTRSTN